MKPVNIDILKLIVNRAETIANEINIPVIIWKNRLMLYTAIFDFMIKVEIISELLLFTKNKYSWFRILFKAKLQICITNSLNLILDLFAALGNKLFEVKPGSVFISKQ